MEVSLSTHVVVKISDPVTNINHTWKYFRHPHTPFAEQQSNFPNDIVLVAICFQHPHEYRPVDCGHSARPHRNSEIAPITHSFTCQFYPRIAEPDPGNQNSNQFSFRFLRKTWFIIQYAYANFLSNSFMTPLTVSYQLHFLRPSVVALFRKNAKNEQ